MRQQKLHLIRQYAAARQVDVLCMRRHKGNREQLHSGLFRQTVTFVVITPLAGGYDILPNITAALTQRLYVITRKIGVAKLIPAIQTKVCVTSKKSSVVEWWSISRKALQMSSGLSGGT